MRPSKKILGSKLAELRDSLFLTQLEMAKLLGIREKRYQEIEGSDVIGVDARRIPLLAAAAKLSPDEFLRRYGANGQASEVLGLETKPHSVVDRFASMFAEFAREPRANQMAALKQMEDREFNWLRGLLNEEFGERNAVKPPLGQIQPAPPGAGKAKPGRKQG